MKTPVIRIKHALINDFAVNVLPFFDREDLRNRKALSEAWSSFTAELVEEGSHPAGVIERIGNPFEHRLPAHWNRRIAQRKRFR